MSGYCKFSDLYYLCNPISGLKAKIAQLVERNLAKVEVAGSNPVFRSFFMEIPFL